MSGEAACRGRSIFMKPGQLMAPFLLPEDLWMLDRVKLH